jgi:O-antigen ligase
MKAHMQSRVFVYGAYTLVFIWFTYNFAGSILVPLLPSTDTQSSGQNFIDQLIMLISVCFSAFFILWSRENIIKLVKNNVMLFILFSWFFATSFWSMHPAITVRRVIGEFIFIVFALCVVPTLKTPKNAIVPIVLVLILTFVLNLVSLVFTPGTAFDDVGNFKGIFLQKNTASTTFFLMTAVMFFYGLSKGSILNASAFFLSALCCLAFMFLAGSKTVIAFALLLSVLFLAMYIYSRFERLPFVLILLAMITIFGFSWVIIVFGDISDADIFEFFTGDPTLTRRTELWESLIRMIDERPIFGFGWGAIWGLGADLNPLPAPTNMWFMDASDINTGHNTFIDVWAQSGVIGFVLAIFFILRTVWVYYCLLASGKLRFEDAALIYGFFFLIVFTILNCLTESYLFQPSSPVGRFFIYLSIFGEYWWMILRSRQRERPLQVSEAFVSQPARLYQAGGRVAPRPIQRSRLS